MPNCPNCGNLLEEEVNFCNVCGAKLASEAVQQEVPVTPWLEENGIFQQEFTEEAPPRKKSRKGWVFAGVGALLAVAAVLVYLFVLKEDKLPSFALYVKDNQLVYSKFSKKTTFELTEKLLTDDLELEDLMDSYYSYVIQTDKDGKRIFFPDCLGEENLDEYGDVESFNLYYRDVKGKGEPVEVDSEVQSYAINVTGTKVMYTKDDNLYIHDLEDKEKIDSDVSGIYPSPDLSKLVYTVVDEETDEETLYYWEEGKEDPQRLTDEIGSVRYVTEDFSAVYYTKNNGTKDNPSTTLYKFIIKKDKSEKIASDIYRVCAIYDSGEVYYTKARDVVSEPMSKWVIDDKRDSDTSMTQPQYPYRSDYSTDSAYEAAWKHYQDVLLPAWEEKVNRDSLRDRIEDEELSIPVYTLCYYDGEDNKDIADVKDGYTQGQAVDKPIVAVNVLEEMDLQQVKLSEITSVWDVRYKVMDATTDKAALVIGNKLVELKHEDATRIQIAKDGSLVYYLTDFVEEEETYDLYKVSVSGNKLDKAERVDSGVSSSWCYILENGSIFYFKDLVDVREEDEDGDTRYWGETGDLYFNGKKVDSDVWPSQGLHFPEDDTLVYITDYDTDDECGTLKRYKGEKKTKIADEVYQFDALPNGDILYLTDYDLEDMEGELYRYSGKKAKKLDNEVVRILTPVIMTEEYYKNNLTNYRYYY